MVLNGTADQSSQPLTQPIMPLLTALFFTLCAHGALGAGNVLMKKGIGWLGPKENRQDHFRRDFLYWLMGFLILNSSGVFMALAVKGLSPHLVTAFAGFGILVMILLARAILREPLYQGDFIGSGLIILSLLILGLVIKPELTDIWQAPSAWGLGIILTTPILFLLAGILKPKISARSLALCSGQSSGIMVILLKILVARHGYAIDAYFTSVFAYLYLFFAILALVSLQLALKKGPMMLVGPLQYGSIILFPPLGALLLGAYFPLWHGLFFIMAVYGIWLIMNRR